VEGLVGGPGVLGDSGLVAAPGSVGPPESAARARHLPVFGRDDTPITRGRPRGDGDETGWQHPSAASQRPAWAASSAASRWAPPRSENATQPHTVSRGAMKASDVTGKADLEMVVRVFLGGRGEFYLRVGAWRIAACKTRRGGRATRIPLFRFLPSTRRG